MALAPGTRLGVYEVVAKIGEGGMGQVYRATDTKLKRQVAIKILPASFAADHDRLARFQREAEVLASLNHPNIAAIYGLEETEGMTALVMELVEGDDLSQLIARRSGGPRDHIVGGPDQPPPRLRRSAGASAEAEGPPLRTTHGNGALVRRGGSSDPPVGIPIDEALAIAKQIAEALEAAH